MPLFGQKLPWEQRGHFSKPNQGSDPSSPLDALGRGIQNFKDTTAKYKKNLGLARAGARRRRY